MRTKKGRAREFEYDLIFEIISRLPLKAAIRFKVLNKTLNSYISNHIEHKHFVESNHKISDVLFSSTSHHTRYMCHLQMDQPYPVKYTHMQFDEQLEWDQEGGWPKKHCSIIASCSGLVLIYAESCKSYCVFNPITTEFQLVPSSIAQRSVGLAVDSITEGENSFIYRTKLIGFFAWINDSKKEVMFKFTTFGFGFDSNLYWKEIDPQVFSYISVFREERYGQGSIYPVCQYAPVYLHGCMFWLFNHGNIIAFDLEKCRARIIDGPRDDTHYVEWFGEVQGSLLLCISDDSDEYVIHAYDHVYTKTWKIQHKIMGAPELEHYWYVLRFDGERLLLTLWSKSREILAHNTSAKEWKTIGRIPDDISYPDEHAIAFVPTLAKLYSGLYLNCQTSGEKLISNDIRSILYGIYQLFSSRNIDNYH